MARKGRVDAETKGSKVFILWPGLRGRRRNRFLESHS